MSKGFNGIPGNLQGMLKQAQKMQEQLQKVQQSTELYSAEGTAGGVITVTANGQNQLTAVQIKKEAVNPEDVEFLQDLVMKAVNEALTKVQEHKRDEMAKVTGGLNIPGLS